MIPVLPGESATSQNDTFAAVAEHLRKARAQIHATSRLLLIEPHPNKTCTRISISQLPRSAVCFVIEADGQVPGDCCRVLQPTLPCEGSFKDDLRGGASLHELGLDSPAKILVAFL